MNFISLARKIYQKIKFGPIPNLQGDRDVEYSFITANLPSNKGRVLDFGSGTTPLTLSAFLKGNEVTAIDLLPPRYYYNVKIKFIQDDILKTKKLKINHFDVIINCSSIEHVGLAGRYGVSRNVKDGDLKAMFKLHQLLKKSGKMLLTIPVGKDFILKPRHRIYGNKRLPLLLKNFKIEKQIFWSKTKSDNRWNIVSRKKALSTKYGEKFYNIGCYVLLKEISNDNNK